MRLIDRKGICRVSLQERATKQIANTDICTSGVLPLPSTILRISAFRIAQRVLWLYQT